jgi:hypothetical protein
MSDFEKRGRRKTNTSQVKFKKKFSVLENFLYQRERKVSRNLMLKANRGIGLSSIFVSVFGAKRGLVNEGTLCKSATVPAAVILCESAHYVTAPVGVGRRCEGGISQKTCRNRNKPYY